MTKFSKIPQFCFFGLVLATSCGGGAKKNVASTPQGSSNDTPPPAVVAGPNAKALEDISPYLKPALMQEEMRKYCFFINAAMIEDPKEEADKRQYTKPLYMNAEREKLVNAHVKLYKLLCNGPKSFIGFSVSNASEKIIVDILTMRHLWALIASQDNTSNIKKVAVSFKGSYFAWEKAFGSPEVRIWKDYYSKHSSMQEDAYQKRVKELSDWAQKEVQSRFNSFL